MRTITVKSIRLKATLEENRKTHNEDHAIAFKKFSERVAGNLASRLESLKAGDKPTAETLYINLTIPVNHDEDYQRALEMLEWEVGDEVELTESEFQQFVQDDWGWKDQVTVSNRFYTGSASPSKLSL